MSWTESSSEAKLIAVQAVHRQDVNKMWGRVEHLPQNLTSNILEDEKNPKIFVFFKFHFQNVVCLSVKTILRSVFKHAVIYLRAKFQVSQIPSGFFANQYHIFTNIWWEFFSWIFWEFLISKKWNFQNLLLNFLESSNSVDRRIVHASSGGLRAQADK